VPIIDKNDVPMPAPEDGRSSRRFVNKDAGAINLTVGELVMQDGSALRLHTHPTDEAIILMEGLVEMIVGEERHVGSPGDTLLAPPGTAHRLINNTGGPARMFTIFPTDDPQTKYVD